MYKSLERDIMSMQNGHMEETALEVSTLLLVILSAILLALRILSLQPFALDFELLIFHLPALISIAMLMTVKRRKKR